MIKKQVLEIILNSNLVDIDRFDASKDFKSNGIDSLDIFAIILEIEESFNVKFSEDEYLTIRGASDVVKLVELRKSA
jgi:acyl carrier protein